MTHRATTTTTDTASGVRRSVTGSWWFRGGLAILLLLPWVIGLSVEAVNENRRPTEFPTPAAARDLLDPKTFRQTDQALKDRLALKTAVTRAVGEASVAAGTSVTNRVVTGVDGTPFSSEEFVAPCRTALDTAAVDARLSRWRTMAQARGGDVFIAIAPDKSTVERSKLGRSAPGLMACADQAREATLAQWGTRPDAVVMTLWDAMAQRQQAAPDSLYQRGDTHWNAAGASVFAESVIARLASELAPGVAPASLNFAGDVRTVGERERFGDLYRLMGSNRLDTVPVVDVERNGVEVKRRVSPGTTFRGVRLYRAIPTAEAAVVPGTTLIVHDSFYDAAEQQLTPYFEKALVMHWSDLTVAAANGRLPQIDRIVFQTSQRSFAERVMVALADPFTQAGLDAALQGGYLPQTPAPTSPTA